MFLDHRSTLLVLTFTVSCPWSPQLLIWLLITNLSKLSRYLVLLVMLHISPSFCSTQVNLYSQLTCHEDWLTSAHGASTWCWVMGAWAPAQEGIQPMASWHSKATPCLLLPLHSRQEGTSLRHPSQISTYALSTGLWCSVSAACYRYYILILVETFFILNLIFHNDLKHLSY